MSDLVGSSSQEGMARYLLGTAITFAVRMSKLAIGLGAIVAGLLYWKQDSLLYFPEIGGLPRRPGQNPRRYRSPSEHQIPFESHKIPCSDGVSIHAWLLFRDDTSRSRVPTIVFFHGNAGNIGLRLPNALQMMQYLNVNVFMVEYRGYGDSDSVPPSEAGLRLDAEAALRFLLHHPRIDAASVYIFGRSLGGAVAFHLARYAEQQQLPLAGVIVENTFVNIAEMVDHLMPVLAPFKWLVLRIRWDSLSIAPTITVPVLYLAGGRDELVPHSHMIRLYQSTTSSRLCRWHVVKDGTHNETWVHGGQEYWDAFRNFLEQARKNASLSEGRMAVYRNVMGASSATGASTLARSSLARLASNGSISNTAGVGTSAIGSGVGIGSSNAIPIMPNGILNMAQESLRTTSTSSLTVDNPSEKKKL